MTEIYSANPIEAFQSQLLTIAFLVGLGLISIPAIPRRGASPVTRIVIGICAGFLIIAGLAMSAITFYQYINGAQSLTGRLAGKQVAVTSSSDGVTNNTSYLLFFDPATQFDVPKSAFDELTEKTCYQISYYPSGGLLAIFRQGTEPPIATGEVASIKMPPANQCR